MPDCPIILLTGDAGVSRNRLSFRPARQVVEGVNCGRWATLKLRGSVRMAERTKIEEHRHASPGLTGMNQSSAHEGISEPMRAVGRVRDDILCKGSVGFQEVQPPLPRSLGRSDPWTPPGILLPRAPWKWLHRRRQVPTLSPRSSRPIGAPKRLPVGLGKIRRRHALESGNFGQKYLLFHYFSVR